MTLFSPLAVLVGKWDEWNVKVEEKSGSEKENPVSAHFLKFKWFVWSGMRL